jgi:SSS family solute:Na+ symporter
MNISLIVTIIFLLLIIISGIVKVKSKDISDFYVTGRKGNTLLISASLIATIVGGSATVGLAGLAYSKGFPAIWWLLSGSICLVILALFLSKKVRDTNVYTMPEILMVQYKSKAISTISALIISIAWLGVISAQISAAGKFMSIIWPGHYNTSVFIAGAGFIIYTMVGGQRAVLRTDLFQGILIFAGIILLFSILYVENGFWDNLSLPEFMLQFPSNEKLSYRGIFEFFLFVGTSFLAGPDIYSRILSSKNTKTAKNSLIIAAISIAILAFMIVSIGIYGKYKFPNIEPEAIFPALIVNYLPQWIKGLVVVSLIAAFLSSANTCLMTCSIILSEDIAQPYIFKGKLNSKGRIFMTRIFILSTGLLSIIISIYSGGVIKSILFALTIYTTSIVIPVVFGFFKERLYINKTGALYAILVGSASTLALKFLSLNNYQIYVFPLVLFTIFAASLISNIFVRLEK